MKIDCWRSIYLIWTKISNSFLFLRHTFFSLFLLFVSFTFLPYLSFRSLSSFPFPFPLLSFILSFIFLLFLYVALSDHRKNKLTSHHQIISAPDWIIVNKIPYRHVFLSHQSRYIFAQLFSFVSSFCVADRRTRRNTGASMVTDMHSLPSAN